MEATFNYRGWLDTGLKRRSGQTVTLIGGGESPDPTFRTWQVRFPDGHEQFVFETELEMKEGDA